MKEQWKSISGYEGLYLISDRGNIFGIKHRRNRKLFIRSHGYYTVMLCKNGVSRQYTVHRLVAKTLLETKQKMDVNHKDGNKLNNNINNLEWCTRSENMKHAFKIGLYKPNTKPKPWNNKKVTNGKQEFISITTASKLLNIGKTSIANCLSGRSKTAGGYKWDYVNG